MSYSYSRVCSIYMLSASSTCSKSIYFQFFIFNNNFLIINDFRCCFYWGKWEKRRWKIRNCLHLAAFAPMSYLMSKLYTCDSLSCPKALTWESGCQTVRPALPSISISPESLVSVSKAPEPQVRGLTAQALAPYLLCDVTNKFRARCWWQVEFHLFLFLFLFFLDVYL